MTLAPAGAQRMPGGWRPAASRAGSPPRRPTPSSRTSPIGRAWRGRIAPSCRTPRRTSPSRASTCRRARPSSTSIGMGDRTSSSRAATATGSTGTGATGPSRTSRQAAGVAGQEGEGAGALAFDYDNDGDSDIYETYLLRPNLLYRNRGDGTFEEVGASAGVDLNDYSTSSAALDYDRDGDADLYVLVYGRPESGPTLAADNAPPNHMYRNEGNGKFTDVSKATHTDDTALGPGAAVRGSRRRSPGPTSTSPTTSATTPTSPIAATARSRTPRRRPASSTRPSAWA